MLRYVLVSLGSGIFLGVMDGVIHANPIAQRFFQVFEPIARKSVNVLAGFAIDIIYGFAMAAAFLLLSRSLPGNGWVKGVSFGVLVWFFRVVMQALTQWMMFQIPAATLLYSLVCGLVEMVILGLLYGLVLRPST